MFRPFFGNKTFLCPDVKQVPVLKFPPSYFKKTKKKALNPILRLKENISFLVELILKSEFFRIAGELENSLFVRLALLPLWENTVQGHETIYPATVRAGVELVLSEFWLNI